MADSNIGWVAGSNGTILKTMDGGGPIDTTSPQPPQPKPRAGLKPSFPNPFNPSINNIVRLPLYTVTTGSIRLRIYDILGRMVFEKHINELPAGNYDQNNPLTPTWNGTDKFGNLLPSGIYLYNYKTRDFSGTGKLVLIR